MTETVDDGFIRKPSSLAVESLADARDGLRHPPNPRGLVKRSKDAPTLTKSPYSPLYGTFLFHGQFLAF